MADNDEPQRDPSTRLSARQVYQSIRYDGEQEMARPLGSLWWSGLAAGIAITASVFAKALLYKELPDSGWRMPIADFGYCVGFVLVVLGRMQLFTENTITVVLPLMADTTRRAFYCTLRLWSVVFVANMAGTFIAAGFATLVGFASPSQLAALQTIAAQAVIGSDWATTLIHGIPAGFFVAALVWMLPNSRGFEIWVIVLPTYLIALGGFAHVVVGSMEVWLLVLSHQLSLIAGVWQFIVPALIGNVLGGTVLFSLLAYGQVRREIDD
ncbi:formate/nitrite transporter family protein [Salinisphaera sp. Q1T1-3]|uniref:formate/nitrite transporter family protein n=1 Tax=Salinisphaera sp. Q1T1-3 TaxID=2321229 RepID=UPI000E724FEF|nr:formate/nitrite transporter family protein [Salinisphaera sp. Q1T1-3]RJS91981.1 formate/nitrite transporter family protein [Salinisphaera sp. Q1T1-3]